MTFFQSTRAASCGIKPNINETIGPKGTVDRVRICDCLCFFLFSSKRLASKIRPRSERRAEPLNREINLANDKETHHTTVYSIHALTGYPTSSNSTIDWLLNLFLAYIDIMKKNFHHVCIV